MPFRNNFPILLLPSYMFQCCFFKMFAYNDCSPSTDASADILRDLIVPQFAFVGDSALLTCEFDLRQSELYSLKWYHNKTEFYRYVPTERTGPINIRPNPKFVLHVSFTLCFLITFLSYHAYFRGLLIY